MVIKASFFTAWTSISKVKKREGRQREAVGGEEGGEQWSRYK